MCSVLPVGGVGEAGGGDHLPEEVEGASQGAICLLIKRIVSQKVMV